jgi:hypothetical protein
VLRGATERVTTSEAPVIRRTKSVASSVNRSRQSLPSSRSTGDISWRRQAKPCVSRRAPPGIAWPLWIAISRRSYVILLRAGTGADTGGTTIGAT